MHPCRIGGKRMLEILTRITEGTGTMDDLGQIDILARTMADSSLCALGQLTPSPTLSSLRYFRDEFIAHIVDKKCTAGAARSWSTPDAPTPARPGRTCRSTWD